MSVWIAIASLLSAIGFLVAMYFNFKSLKESCVAEERSEGMSGKHNNADGAQNKSTRVTVAGDNPIRNVEEDVLGRSAAARSFAEQALSVDASAGVVVGVLGPWGSGKTSFVNLSRSDFERAGVAVLDFNPWMFSGAEQLVQSFFIELSAQLKMRRGLDQIGRNLEEYGEGFVGLGWLPVLGPWIERGRAAAKAVGRILQHQREGISARRTKLEMALRDLDRPILVVIDDVDRLSTPEIQDIFKLVRLTASFPNIIYILCFDRDRVETALGEQGVPGRAYLEKILQVAVDIPAIASHVINEQVFVALDSALSGLEDPGPFDEEIWPDIFVEVVRPLIRNMRDVRRYAAAVRGTVQGLRGQIALSDVLGLEAIRVFLPDVFARLHNSIEGLTKTSGMSYGGVGDPPYLKKQVDELFEAADGNKEVVKSMIERLFPAGQRHIGSSHYGPDWQSTWLRKRKVAHEDILRLYLERILGKELQAFSDAEKAWKRMADEDAFNTYLRAIDPGRLQDVIGALEAYEDLYVPEYVGPSVTVLLNIMPYLPERPHTIFGLDTQIVVTRVTYRLIRSLGNETKIEEAVRQILPKLDTLSAKFELISTVGYREGVGHKLISESAAAELESAWREEVRSVSVAALDLEREFDLLRVLYWTKLDAEPLEPPLEVPSSPRVTAALLRSAKSDAISQTMGNRAVRRSPRLAWDVLVELYGEESLRRRIDELRAEPHDADELVELADKYLSGWRPKAFGDDPQ